MPEAIETIVVEVQVSKEAHEFAQGVAKFVVDLKQAVSDGFQAGQDLPAALSSAVDNLVPAMSGVMKLKDEYQGSKAAFINAILLPLAGALGAVLD